MLAIHQYHYLLQLIQHHHMVFIMVVSSVMFYHILIQLIYKILNSKIKIVLMV